MTSDTLTFVSDGVDLRGLALRRASTTRWHTEPGRPVVVMAHGLAGTMDSGLAPFAEALAAAGLDVLAVRLPRLRRQRRARRARRSSLAGQVDDYRAAMATPPRDLPGVDPQPAGALGRLAGRRARARGRRAPRRRRRRGRADPAGRRPRRGPARPGAATRPRELAPLDRRRHPEPDRVGRRRRPR